MAHYAFLQNNIVVEIIVGVDENQLIDGLTPEEWYGNYRNQTCVRTSYNGRIRKNYAGIGFTYDPDRDAFIAPEPEGNLGFDEETCQWIMPFVERIIVNE